ncbi:THAP domain-containing protein 7 isoform X1 [Betta splendens]|nr:THAP domain-containing protein 7 isoform X1 [Betta splendens]XP_029023334.1 THAP domain-containing protein 7 isoform X1 [Betta splendens]XP_029023335.1 THAP domain-containing protein 7 isoform X1 [Betta splendens]XP_055368607.1 THAP domain-containing protein 7 isoform X1 [Betta splendens]
MPRHCSAGGCKSRDNRETRNAGITFHKLPRRAIRRKLWITNSHRTDSWDPQTDFVYFCSRHFTPDSFELTGCSGIRRLKEDAFPSVFESSSTTKTKRAGIQQDNGEPTVQRSVAEKESHENIPVFSQELLGVTQLPQQELSPSPPPESHPTSPSRYMRRLPPPPGFYLSKEHSYAQLCPLLWRRRYNQAIDCLEKAVRQLHASRRRENRLRSTLTRLRKKQLKHTLLVSGDSCNNRSSWTPGGHKRRGRKMSNREDNETDFKFEDTTLFEDRCMEQMKQWDFLPDGKTWSEEEEERYCFYCGRGQEQGLIAPTLLKNKKTIHPTHYDVAQKALCVKDITCDMTDNTSKICRLGKHLEISDLQSSQIVRHTPSAQCVTSGRLCLTDPHNQKLLLSDACGGECDAIGQEYQLDLQHEFWIHSMAEGHVILVPVPHEEELKNFVKMEDDTVKIRTILVSEVKPKGELEHNPENSVGLSGPKAACGVEHCDITSVSAERRENVMDKLKEHLEGFQLQLSTEF